MAMRIRVIPAVLAALALMAPHSLAGERVVPCATPPEPFSHAGRWITDASGRVIIVRGLNMVNKLPPYSPAAAGFGEKDARLLEREGFNVVRVGMIYSAVEPFPGHYDDGYIDSIRSTVELLHRHGIMSLIDCHQDSWGPVFHAEGFPRWATFTDGFPVYPIDAFPDIYFTSKALQHAYDNFWWNTRAHDGVGIQDHFAKAWAHAANRLRHAPGILGWELLNEPFPGSDWRKVSFPPYEPMVDRTVLTPFIVRVLRAIRTVDSQHIVWYQPWASFTKGAKTFVDKIDDPKLGFAFHNYVPPGGLQLPYTHALEHSELTGTALLTTEYGAALHPSVITQQVADADLFMMPAIYWAYWDRTPYVFSGFGHAAEFGIVRDLKAPLVPGNVSVPRLDALVRPYPRAIAGTPIEWSYDPESRTFALTYGTAPATPGGVPAAGVESEIFIPRRHYPAGYRVSVSGAQVVSGPHDQLLRLVNRRRIGVVTVQVVPKR